MCAFLGPAGILTPCLSVLEVGEGLVRLVGSEPFPDAPAAHTGVDWIHGSAMRFSEWSSSCPRLPKTAGARDRRGHSGTVRTGLLPDLL